MMQQQHHTTTTTTSTQQQSNMMMGGQPMMQPGMMQQPMMAQQPMMGQQMMGQPQMQQQPMYGQQQPAGMMPQQPGYGQQQQRPPQQQQKAPPPSAPSPEPIKAPEEKSTPWCKYIFGGICGCFCLIIVIVIAAGAAGVELVNWKNDEEQVTTYLVVSHEANYAPEWNFNFHRKAKNIPKDFPNDKLYKKNHYGKKIEDILRIDYEVVVDDPKALLKTNSLFKKVFNSAKVYSEGWALNAANGCMPFEKFNKNKNKCVKPKDCPMLRRHDLTGNICVACPAPMDARCQPGYKELIKQGKYVLPKYNFPKSAVKELQAVIQMVAE